MEVHAHSHTQRKKWAHYFWEFLMLFLAVTLGFFVENSREHYVENIRAEEYARGLLEDLKKDTANLSFNRAVDLGIMSYVDSLQLILNRFNNSKEITGAFYFYSRLATTIGQVNWSRATLHQVIFSGNARYFKNQELMKKISEYYTRSEFISKMVGYDHEYRRKCMELRSGILKSNHFAELAAISRQDTLEFNLKNNAYPLQSNDPTLLNEYLNSFHNRKAILTNLVREIDVISLLATEIIEMIKKEYPIK